MEEKITYFEEAGTNNTEATLKLAIERAKARGIKKMVLASTRGDTAKIAAERLAGTGIKMVAVPWQYGFKEPGSRFPEELKAELAKKGHAVHFGTMLFHTEHFYGNETSRAMANLLRTFCQGMKVCVEITLMATDGGHLAQGEYVVVVAGTGRGSDTAVIAQAAPSTKIVDFHITEIICKPLQTRNAGPPPQQPPAQPEKK
ncbi:MAG TPA: pyruvate kinase alpha/beta domain-containing protein [Dehalococcoidales bacterium]|nr:pyruvate kinase alpha/beta domain-containing protein [Dehalococcoidales bacterium]